MSIKDLQDKAYLILQEFLEHNDQDMSRAYDLALAKYKTSDLVALVNFTTATSAVIHFSPRINIHEEVEIVGQEWVDCVSSTAPDSDPGEKGHWLVAFGDGLDGVNVLFQIGNIEIMGHA